MKNNTTPTGYAEMFEWADGNLTHEDRAAYSVTIDHDDKIRIAAAGDIPFGIVAGDNTSVHHISGANTDGWHGKHVRDTAKRLSWEPQVMVEWVENGYRHWYEADRIPEGITVPAIAKYYGDRYSSHKLQREILSEEFKNPGKIVDPYLSRWERKEWAIVIMLGRTLLREQQPFNPNWINLGMQDLTIGEFENNLYEFLVK